MPLVAERIESQAPPRKLMTAQDLELMPSDERLELIRGELCLMPNNSAEHGNKTATVSTYVGIYVLDNNLGECFAAETRFTIEQNPDTVLGPDFSFVAKHRLTRIPPKGYLRLAPDLIMETRSPGDTTNEFRFKIARWLAAGVKVAWALEPSNLTLTIHKSGELPKTLTIDDTLTCEELLPGFSLPMRRVFRDVVPCD